MNLSRVIVLLAIHLLLTVVVQAQPEPQSLNYKVPERVLNAEIYTFDQSQPFKLADYKDKVVVLAFWAYWCRPCRWALDDLRQLNKEYAGQPVEVIGISIGYPREDVEEAKQFVRNAEFPFKVGWINNDLGTLLMSDHAEVPNIIIINREGIMVKRFLGFNPAKTSGQLRDVVEQALKKPEVQ